MTQSTPSINELKSYTEYNVSTPTSVFTIGFQYEHNVDHVNVYVDGIEATAAGYTIQHDSQGIVTLTPAVPSGVVRLSRETNIDTSAHTFSAGAKFTAGNMDENFQQIRHAQQEVRDGFSKLSTDTYEIIDTLQDVGQAAQDAADAAEQAAQTANDAAAQVNDKVSYQDLDNAIAATPHNNLVGRDVAGAHPASAILDKNGKSQQEVNDEQELKNKAVVSTADFGSVGVAQNIPVSAWYTVGSSHYRGYADLAAVQADYPHVTDAGNTVDWAAAQKACNVAGQGGSVLIRGCLFFKEGEKLVVPARQKLYGLGSPLFINTNNGLMFTGSLTGVLPEYGIYYDGESGSPLRCGEAVILEGFHLFGKGLKVADGSINILQIHDAEYWPTVGVEVEKFIITDNFSVYYFNEAIRSLQGGNYYSRFSKTEITRCSVAFSYEVSSYNQDFFGVTMREVREPFKFSLGAFARGFNYFGGSIEGFRPQVGQAYAVGVPANSFISFKGTYFENLENSGIHEAVFLPLGSNAVVQFDACTIYLNHFKNWVKQPNQIGFKVVSRGNEFLLSTGSRVKNPTIYNVQQTGTFIATVDTDGSDKIRFARGYPSITKSASIVFGSKSLVFTDITDVYVGQRIIITSINLETVITGISGNTATLQAIALADYTGNVDVYFTPLYLPFSIGLPLLNHRIVYPLDYLSYFDDIQFEKVSGKAVKARSKAPDAVFNGANSGVSTYVADYTSWNPSGKRDGRGAYPVAYRGGKYIPQLGSFTGSFTCSSGSLTIVNDTNVSANSVVLLVPKNSAAANLSKNGFYISEIANSTRFNITFLTSAAGTEEFDYTITD